MKTVQNKAYAPTYTILQQTSSQKGARNKGANAQAKLKQKSPNCPNFAETAEIRPHPVNTATVRCGGETNEEHRKAEQQSDPCFPPCAPVERIFLIVAGELEYDVLLVVFMSDIHQRKGCIRYAVAVVCHFVCRHCTESWSS